MNNNINRNKSCTVFDREIRKRFDFIRGGAIILIVITHANQIFIAPHIGIEETKWITNLARVALMTLFSLSGVLIFFSIKKGVDGKGVFCERTYFKKRVNRIYPPLLVSILLLVLLTAAISLTGFGSINEFSKGDEKYLPRSEIYLDWDNIISSSLLLNEVFIGHLSPILNGPLWSVAHEFWFYMCAMIILMVGKKNYTFGLCLYLLTIPLLFTQNEFFLYGWIVWSVGFISAYFSQKGERKYFYLYSCGVSLIGLLAYAFFMIRSDNSWYEYRSYYFVGISISALLPTITWVNGPAILKKSGYINSFFYSVYTNITNIAGYGYTLYLIHFPIFLTIFVFTNKKVEFWQERITVITLAMIFVFYVSAKIGPVIENRNLFKMALSNVKLRGK